jgi:entericidin B
MRSVLIVLLGLSVLSLTACNTVAGVGQDTQAAGRGLENAADKAKPK